MIGYARAVARRGVVVFVPEWQSFPAQLEEHRLAALEDVACAVRFARERAGDYGGHGQRIVAAGWSLGANFGAIAVLRADPVEGDCTVGPDVSSRAQGLVGLDGVYDFTELILADPSPPVSWSIEEVNEISAHTYVRTADGDDPPVFRLFSGIEEQLHAQAERFRKDLEEGGFDVEVVRHPELSHGAMIFAPGTVEALVDLAFG
jgi:acetyl esterase/lipase